ncbi:MAG: ankyrin repeat domain-containing protein [Elusimicrobiota bacterium]|jgi:ankyrin repeat protein|nr:ankyrin repeat domain-containing protein [Elusimicrobiota bacterium]
MTELEAPHIFIAVFNNDLDSLKTLISYNANVNYTDKYGITPLLLAVKLNNFEVVQLLIRSGASIDIANSHKTQFKLVK